MSNHRQKTKSSARLFAATILGLVTSMSPAPAQVPTSSKVTSAPVPLNETSRQTQAHPLTLTLLDALARAQKNDPQFQSAVSGAKLAHEDRLQSRAAPLPTLDASSQYLNTQGNGVIPTGRLVTNDGVHVYREWGVIKQDLSPTALTKIGYKRAVAAEAIARSKTEIARLGLAVTVTKAYYALVVAQRKYATAQQGLDQADRLLAISQRLERSGGKAHSDVVKLQLQQNAQEKSLREANLAMESARLDLAVLLFRDFSEDFEVVDDMRVVPGVPSFSEALAMAEAKNPGLLVAMSAVRVASLNVSTARQAFLPSVKVEVDYGIESNCIGLRCVDVGELEAGPARTLGYFMTAVLTLPVWDWGVRKSKLRQAEFKHEQATVELSATRRQLVKNLHAAYQETQTAHAHIDPLRQAVDLAAESLRLNISRYQAGETSVLEVVDAHNTLTQARSALDDGELRYRVAVANLQTFTGSF